MRVAITGSSGLIGRALTRVLRAEGDEVVRVVRSTPEGGDEIGWDPDHGRLDAQDLRGVDAVVHLAGESLFGFWSGDKKRRILGSRTRGTTLLAAKLAELATAGGGPSVLVSASGINYYGSDRGDEVLTEESSSGTGFLAEVCRQWEDATRPAEDAGIRVVRMRTAVVQSPEGMQLRLQLPLFKLGLGGRLGSGKQWQSWIALDDLVGLYLFALRDEELSGPVNATSPEPVRNATYAEVLAKVVRRPARLPVPSFGPAFLLGPQGAREIALYNLRVHPGVAQERGYTYAHPDLEDALRHVLGRPVPRS